MLGGWISKSIPSDLLYYLDVKGQRKPVMNAADWQLKRKQIISGMEQVMGKLPSRQQLPPLNIIYLDSLKTAAYTRYNIRFTVAENEQLPAYLYVPQPKKQKQKRAAMLVLHGTGDAGKKLVDGESPLSNRAQAKELAQRGYVVIAPDYPSFGDLKDYDFTKDRYQSGTMKAIFNHMRCVDLLQARPEVDANRIGVIGHSLGGHNAMFVGAFDPRLKVIVASCGWTPFAYYNIGEEGSKRYGGRLGPWAQDRYMPLIRDKFNLDEKQIPFDFDEVIAALAPRAFFSNSPVNDTNFDVNGVKKGIQSASEVYRFLKAADNLQVRYPVAGHDFPTETRLQAYQFVDKILKHIPNSQELE
ncbi:hypothetical protein AAE02nite_24290 [Adhaeribacter aerolatus]|uniref:4-O-methyl-glucuronoyl methylesterase-like domain-containing protein n=2 Tax=Adhaeribacter aerolatus TaxID=670289 RepID=A0A512AYG0_9BACT|nr:hypothetical protein AAE02nite_24290 [Adhaeribacter aerolatus]